MKNVFTAVILFIFLHAHSQDTYTDSLESYQKNYVQKHEVVTGADKQLFRFYPVSEKYKVTAMFEKSTDRKWLNMETSGTIKKTFSVYGVLYFTINDTNVALTIYQSQNLVNNAEYKDYLFIPFTDRSSGEETYPAGRYIDLKTTDIINNRAVIDFNKAYNPYCAYVSDKYNCPIPPKENHLAVTIAAGEKTFAKDH